MGFIEEMALRLKTYGYNELPSSKPRSVLAIAFDVIKGPGFFSLDGRWSALPSLGRFGPDVHGFLFVVVMGIAFYQGRKTERSLEALRSLYIS